MTADRRCKEACDKAWMRGFATCVTGCRDVLHERGTNGKHSLRMLVEENGFELSDFENCDLSDFDLECMRWVFSNPEED